MEEKWEKIKENVNKWGNVLFLLTHGWEPGHAPVRWQAENLIISLLKIFQYIQNIFSQSARLMSITSTHKSKFSVIHT